MPWKQMLAWVAGQIDDSLRQELEFVLEENRVYRALQDRHSPGWRLQDAERKSLAEKGRPLGKLLATFITIVQPETLLRWHRRLVAKKWDFSTRRARGVGRPPVETSVEKLIVQLAKENPGWGYDRIAGAMANLGHPISDQTVGNILRRHGLGPAPERRRQTTWVQFIRRHKAVLWATDFFTAEVRSATGLVTVSVLFFIHLQTRKLILGGLTAAPHEQWVKQIACNATGITCELAHARYLIHDRDGNFTEGFDRVLPESIPIRQPHHHALRPILRPPFFDHSR